MIEDITKLREIYRLKEVYRMARVNDRHESSAEHTWSALMLADYFLSKFKYNLNRERVFEILLYHDLVEIETGDIPFAPNVNRIGKKDLEKKSAEVLFNKLPKEVGQRFITLFLEFEKQESKEAKFAKIIDILDSQIHELDYKKDWKGWTEKFLRDNKEKYFYEFEEMKDVFDTIINYCKTNGYFSQ